MHKEAKNTITIGRIIDIILRWRWLIIIPFCIALAIGGYLAVTLPRFYKAETLILIQPQKVPDDYVRSIVSVDAGSRLNSISQLVLSRTNLEKIINEFKLYSTPGYKNMFMEDKVAGLSRRISVRVTRSSRRRTDSFAISFAGKDPVRVMKIVNTLASFVIDENIKVREAQATGTSDFLQDELDSIKKRLVYHENSLKIYKEKYMGGLPEQIDSNLRVLDRLQVQIDAANENLRDVNNRIAALASRRPEAGNGSEAQPEIALSSLDQMRQQLADLQMRYTKRHPDVIRLKRMVAELETEEKEIQGAAGDESVPQPLDRRRLLYTAANMRQLNELNSEKVALKSEIQKLREQIGVYQNRVEDTPKREQELLSLKRDYDNIRDTYNSLLSRKLEAELSVNMEKKQKGEQFRIIDPARIPAKPISPDMKKLFLLTIAAGLGFGGGIIFLLEFFNKSFREIDDMESFLGITVLAAIPPVYHPKDIILKRFHNILSLASVFIAFIMLTGFAAITFKGVDKTIEFVKKII